MLQSTMLNDNQTRIIKKKKGEIIIHPAIISSLYDFSLLY